MKYTIPGAALNVANTWTAVQTFADVIRFNTGVAITAGQYEFGRDADATNQMHFNVPDLAGFEWSTNDVALMTLSSGLLTLYAGAVSNQEEIRFNNDANYGIGKLTGEGIRIWCNAVTSLILGNGAFASTARLSIGTEGEISTGDEFWLQTPAAIGALAANTVKLGLTDIAAGDARLSIQAELGGPIYIGNSAIRVGAVSAVTGKVELLGTTSGLVTLTVAGAAGTWTMTLPAAVGAAGQQLTDAGGDGITSWAAASSLREYKNDLGELSPAEGLRLLLAAPVHRFTYKEGMGTGDYATEYVGLYADEAPWAMHYKGSIVNPVNALGYSVLGIQALHKEIAQLKARLKVLEPV